MYATMVEAGVVRPFPVLVLMDKLRNIAVSPDDAYGLHIVLDVIHSNYIIFVDEVRNNTNIKDNNQVGGKRKIGAKGDAAKETVTTNIFHYTTLGFTASKCRLIMCAQIFAAKDISTYNQIGIDKRIPKDANDKFLEANYGPSKRFPSRPTCFPGERLFPVL